MIAIIYYYIYCIITICFASIYRHILPQLPQIPMLIVAMVTEQSCDSHVTQEGQQLAEQYGALFLASSSPHWASECSLSLSLSILIIIMYVESKASKN